MELKLDGEVFQAAMHKAVIDALGENGTKTLVESAVKYLLSKSNPERYNSETVLQRAIHQSVSVVAHKWVTEFLETPEQKAQLVGLVQEAMNKIFIEGDIRSDLVAKIARGISNSLTGRDY